MESFMFQALIYLTAAVIAVPIAARLGLGSVLGYLAAGILIGPFLGIIGMDPAQLQHIAEFGVVMMLFLIGLELEPRTLWEMRHRLFGLGGLQIVLTTLVVMAGAMALGQVWSVALAIGMIFALSSTAIVLQTLSEKGLMQTSGGRSAFSVLLAQDIAVIPMLALMPLIALPKPPVQVLTETLERLGDEATPATKTVHDVAHSFIEGLPGWGVTLVTIGIVAGIILAGKYLVNPVFRFIHTTHLREMYTALALLIVVGIAFLMSLVGLSPALGAFLAGVVLASSEFRHELESDIAPFKGLLLGLLLTVTMTMLITPLLFILYDYLSKNTADVTAPRAPDKIDTDALVIIAGIGRFGQVIDRLVRSSGFNTVVLDNDLDAIQRMRRFGVKGFLGDPTRPELLHAAGLKTAKVLVVAIDDPDAAVRLVALARRERPDLHIIARAHDRTQVFRLYQAGANDIVREMFDSSLRAGRYVLENMGLSEFEAHNIERAFYEHDRKSVAELAALWDPDKPTIKNTAYIQRAIELEKDLQTMLLTQMEEAAAERLLKSETPDQPSDTPASEKVDIPE